MQTRIRPSVERTGRLQLPQRLLLASALLAAGLTGAGTSLAQGVPPSVTQIYPRAVLSVGPIRPSPVLEHTSMEVPFRLDVEPGLAGARPTYDLAVCEEDSANCVPFPQVKPPWRSPRGSRITARAPAAGRAMPVTLVACVAVRNADSVLSCGHRLGAGSSSVDVKMRFAVHFDSFTILHTRAHNRDTTYYLLAGISNGQPVPSSNRCPDKLAGFLASPIACVGPSAAGDLDDGKHELQGIRVGEFEWVPGRTNHVTFSFATVNYGAPVLPLGGPVVDMRGLAMQRLLDKLTASNAGVSEDFTAEINDLNGWRGCDGPTAAGAKRIFNFRDQSQQEPTVDELTRASGQFSSSSKEFVVPSQTGCGASSKYQVHWSLRRMSWSPN